MKKSALLSIRILLSVVLLFHATFAVVFAEDKWSPVIVVCQRPVGIDFVENFMRHEGNTTNVESPVCTYTVGRGLGGWAIRHGGIIWHGFLGQAEINTGIDTPDVFEMRFNNTHGFASRFYYSNISDFGFKNIVEPEVEPFKNLRCEVLVDTNDLQHEEYVRTRAGGSVAKALMLKWTDATNTMKDEAKKNKYETFFNNCFSVVKKVAKAIGGRQKVIDNINKPNLGIGTSKVTEAVINGVLTVGVFAIGLVIKLKFVSFML